MLLVNWIYNDSTAILHWVYAFQETNRGDINVSQEFVFLVLLALTMVAASVIAYVYRDIRSGNYRKLLSEKEEHEQFQKTVQDVRKTNMGA